jgi:hypothetical protein
MEKSEVQASAERCSNIRWKGMFIDVQGDPIESQAGERVYWCVQTQNCLGPDGQIVDEGTCNLYRSCYRPV